LPEDHLAHFVSDTVDALELRAFYKRYEGDGRRNRPFDPRMMVKLLVYGYATSAFSSRKIAKRLVEDVGFRMLAAGNTPAHRTIAEFRLRHISEFKELFVQVVRLAGEAGVVKLGTVAIDGSKLKANASRHKAMSYGRMCEKEEQLRAEIDALLERANEVDAEEDSLYGPDNRGDELPEGLRRREDRLRKIREAKARLEQRQAEEDRAKGRSEDDDRKSPKGGRRFKRDFGIPENSKQDNFTDPQSRIMKTSRGFEPCYNPQLAVDESSHLVVATLVTANAADNDQLLAVVDAVEDVTGTKPAKVLADAGYRSEPNLDGLEQRGIDGYISLRRKSKKQGKKLKNHDLPATSRMREKLETNQGKQHYSKRKWIVEPVFGWAKEVLGFRQFSLRGLKKVTGEWELVCLALNLRRLNRLIQWA
jgi:transposase